MGHSRSSELTLMASYYNLVPFPISVENRNFFLIPVYLTPDKWGFLELGTDVIQKLEWRTTRCSESFKIGLGFAVSTQCRRVTDGQTDGLTRTPNDGKGRANQSVPGKKIEDGVFASSAPLLIFWDPNMATRPTPFNLHRVAVLWARCCCVVANSLSESCHINGPTYYAITQRAKLSGAVWCCYRSCLFVCVCLFVCGFVCLLVGLLPR